MVFHFIFAIAILHDYSYGMYEKEIRGGEIDKIHLFYFDVMY